MQILRCVHLPSLETVQVRLCEEDTISEEVAMNVKDVLTNHIDIYIRTSTVIIGSNSKKLCSPLTCILAMIKYIFVIFLSCCCVLCL
jgi:hypothetical protein